MAREKIERERFINEDSWGVHLGGLAVKSAWESTMGKEEALTQLRRMRIKAVLVRGYPLDGVKALTSEELTIIRCALPSLLDHRRHELLNRFADRMPVHRQRLQAWLDGWELEKIANEPTMIIGRYGVGTPNSIYRWKDHLGERVGQVFPNIRGLIVPDVESYIRDNPILNAREPGSVLDKIATPLAADPVPIVYDGVPMVLRKIPSLDPRIDDFDPTKIVRVDPPTARRGRKTKGAGFIIDTEEAVVDPNEGSVEDSLLVPIVEME